MDYDPQENLNPELFAKIMSRIDHERKLAILRTNSAYSAAFLVLSATGFFLGSHVFVSEAIRSGMFDFIRLAFSDARVISFSFNELALSFVQSLPIDTLIVVLALFAGMLRSAYALLCSISDARFISEEIQHNR